MNIGSQRVELLSSMPFGHGNKVTLRITKTNQIYITVCESLSLKYKVEFTKFDHVCTDVPQQTNG